METVGIIGRIIFGGYFLYSGINHFIGFAMMTQYAKMKGVPFPAVAQGITGLMLSLGGLSIVFGIYPLVGVALLVAFLVPVSLMMHDFWKLQDPQLRMADKVNFLKNMALLGAVLMLLAIPFPWPLSLVP
ncbi:MAG: DoxX family membrane protein [Bacteroidota bacterium]